MHLIKTPSRIFIFLLLLVTSSALLAAWSDWRQKIEDMLPTGTPNGVEATKLSQDEIGSGLKEALHVGVERATSLLGKKGGFLNDEAVKIPLPGPLEKVERGLRAVGQDAVVDEFIMSMNRAAEKAVPETTAILADTIKNMSLKDARGILNGPDDAATQYFREQNETRLTDAILPIVKDTTAEVGVTSSYKRMTGKLGPLAQYVDMDRLDLDQYIAGKTLDGLFLKLAQEEERIREDPVARSTELLKKVFANSR